MATDATAAVALALECASIGKEDYVALAAADDLDEATKNRRIAAKMQVGRLWTICVKLSNRASKALGQVHPSNVLCNVAGLPVQYHR